MTELLPHVWDTRGGLKGLIIPSSHADISTALMRPRRSKQHCLQLVIYIYIYNFMFKNGDIYHIIKHHDIV